MAPNQTVEEGETAQLPLDVNGYISDVSTDEDFIPNSDRASTVSYGSELSELEETTQVVDCSTNAGFVSVLLFTSS